MKKIWQAIGKFFKNIFQGIAIGVLFVYTKIRFKIKLNKNNIELPNEACIFLCNHQNNWDGVFFRLLIPKRIYFLVHDELFKNKFTSWCSANLIDTVKRGSSKNDISAIRQLLQLKKENKNIGIFPEGGIPFWCETMPIPSNIAKLCKKLDMPIVLHQIIGASFQYPRYSANKARIRPVIERKRLISKEELKTISVEELTQIINENLYVNEWEMQKIRKIDLHRKHPAEKVERGLFCCPNCYELNTLKSEDNIIKCTNCNFYNRVNEFELLESDNEKFKFFDNFVEWDKFQNKHLAYILEQYNELDKPIISQFNADIQYAEETELYHKVEPKDGYMEIFKDKIAVTIGLDSYEISFSENVYAYVEFRDTLEIKTSAHKLRLHAEEFVCSPYQMAKTINALKNIYDKNTK